MGGDQFTIQADQGLKSIIIVNENSNELAQTEEERLLELQ